LFKRFNFSVHKAAYQLWNDAYFMIASYGNRFNVDCCKTVF